MNNVPLVAVTQSDLQEALHLLGLSGQAICVHSSLRSFGRVAGGAQTVVQAFLDEGCTILVPTFSWDFAVTPPAALQVPRNGWDYDFHWGERPGEKKIYRPTTKEIDEDM